MLSVEEIIDKYAIRYSGGNMIAVHGQVTDEEVAQIREMKPQILEHFRKLRKMEQASQSQAHAVINAIPGVTALREYWQAAAKLFRDDLDCQDYTYQTYEEFVQEYPEIDFDVAQLVLRIEQDRFSPNVAVELLAQAAFSQLAAGEDPADVTRQYKLDWNKLFDDRIRWSK